ncbi:MAG: DedA family protein [Gemmatimonadota bacterium]|nr:DedA family protein [Gemmatimonadota bacterium]
MSETLQHLVTAHGYWIVALVVMLEGFGVPLPGEAALITASAFAAQGRLAIAGVIIASSIGTIFGGSGGFWIGRTGGVALVRRHGRWVGLTEERLKKARKFYDSHGAKTVFLARFIALLRIVVGILAGVSEMSFARFTLYNALGGITWSIAFGAIGYLFGQNLPRLEKLIGRTSLIVLLAAIVVAAIVFAWKRHKK